MNNYQKINNLTGWLVFIVSTIVYLLTVERTASYWDCGEFIAVSYKLQVPHPPGAPFFLLIGRLFSFFALGDVEQVAYWVNVVSVLSSGFTILFLFWSITLLGKKMFSINKGEETPAQTVMLMGSALVGSLAYTFSDSFWFSAVEAEVYGMSSFFTAFVVWAMLKWNEKEDESTANKWIILICYMMGLSIGVHLLNLVTIPALGLIYYFKKYKPSRNGIIATLLVSGFIVIFINNIIIPEFPNIAGKMEIGLVNGLGLPFGSGIVLFALLLIGSLVYGIYYSHKNEKVLLNTILLGLTFIIIGYSSYTLVVIRSNYNPPIDENNPENIISFVSYLKREQYGSRPLLYGQYFDAEITEQERGQPIYVKGKDKYEIVDYKINYKYDPKRSTILPRAYSSDPRHIENYRNWMGIGPNEKPNFVDNVWFMIRYQIGHMYMRYFMWNFAGRESDYEGAQWLRPWDSFQDLPELLEENKGRNNYFMLPLLLGILGLIFQLKRDPKNFSFVAMLFFLTGAALVLYLNSPPVEPRERDYIYVGSFYAFAMWIGFGVMSIANFLNEKMKNLKASAAIATAVCMIVPGIMAAENWDDHDRSNRYFSVDSAKNYLASCAPNAILFTGGDNDTFPLWYAQEVEGFRTDVRVIVLSYFNTDWYIEQMERQAYESDPLPFSLTKDNYYQGGPNDILPYMENPQIKGAISLNQYMKLVRDNHQAIQVQSRFGRYNSIPSKELYLNIDSASVVNKGVIPEDKLPFMTKRMTFTMKRNSMEKNTLMILDLIAQNNWERPIYFNHTSLSGVGVHLNKYVVQEGNCFRLLPVENPNPRAEFINKDVMFDNVMNNFFYRELDNPNTYYNEQYRNFVLNHRSTFNSLAVGLINAGDKERAKEAILKSFEVMPDEAIPFDFTNAQAVGILMEVGEKEKALEVAKTIAGRSEEFLSYVLNTNTSFKEEGQRHVLILNDLSGTMKKYGEEELAEDWGQKSQMYYRALF